MAAEHLTEELSEQDRLLLVFGYLGPLAIVALVVSRRELVKWHAKQGLLLWTALAALWVLLRPIHFFLDRYLWAVFAELFRAGLWLLVLGTVVAVIVCVVRGLAGERFKIPLIGDLTDRL